MDYDVSSRGLRCGEKCDCILVDGIDDVRGVDHRCEMYPEALHGWTMADFTV
jgi:hypothetical protein